MNRTTITAACCALAVAGGLAVSACGRDAASPGASPSPPEPSHGAVLASSPTAAVAEPYVSPTPTGSPPILQGMVTLTTADYGRELTVRRGTSVTVTLAQDGSPGSAWAIPASSNNAVLRPASSALTSGGGATATFIAGGLGPATLSATDSPPTCNPECGASGQTWHVDVTVVA